MKSLFILIQFLVPQRLLSRVAGRLAVSRLPWLKNLMIDQFIRIFGVDMSEAADADPHSYANFNAFFTRALRQDVRPIDGDPKHAVCPADGSVSQLGEIRDGRIFQAKGRDYSLVELLGGRHGDAEPFQRGRFATIYLSPRDYHRVHMPVDGTLRSMTHVPGELFSVNDVTASRVDRLFARNERLICHFDTPAGPMAMVLVGAMIVASVETVWAGQVTPVPRSIRTVDYRQPRETVSLKKGEEMGLFKLGSTVILLFGEDRIQWLARYEAGSRTRMGEALGAIQV